MEQRYYVGNRARFCEAMEPNSVAVIFAGEEIRKTNDEYYPFFTDRNFLYLTGLDSKEFILMMRKDARGQVTERVYILAPDLMAERWTGRRLKPAEVREVSGIEDIRYVDRFEGEFHSLACSGLAKSVYLDLFRVSPEDIDRPAHRFLAHMQKEYPYLQLATSNYMFSIIRPGMKMVDVDATIRRYNAERMMEAGVIQSVDEIGTYMWHGGAHHIGYDVHDVVETPQVLAPGMIFCVDVGIYHEEWGIGFRLEDNCLVTEDGCENLSAGIPRTVEEIEAVMAVAGEK